MNELVAPSGSLKFEHRELAWPKNANWSGNNGYRGKADGRHTFSIKLTHEEADQLAAQHWPVRVWHRDDEDDPDKFSYFMNLQINYHGYSQPKVYKVDLDRKIVMELTEDTLKYLDGANVVDVNVVFHCGVWHNGNDEGLGNYVDTLYANVQNMTDFGDEYTGYSLRSVTDSSDTEEDAPFV